MKYLERQGTFKAKALEWAVKEANTGTVGISILFECRAVKQGEDWREVMPPAFVRGDFYVVKKDGEVMQKTAHELCCSFAWGGSFDEVRAAPPPDVIVQIDVEVQTYQGKQYYKARHVRPENMDALGDEVSEARAKELDKKHGAPLQEVARKAAALRAETSPTAAQSATTEAKPYAGQDGDIPF